VSIDSLDVSPDGTQVLFTVLDGKDRADFHSRMEMVRTDGTGGVQYVSDGKSLDLTPCFSPGGDQIAFASDRFGRKLSICTMSTNGAPGVRKITSGDNNDLWPSIDSEPSPHLFYQSMVDTPRTTPLRSPDRRDDPQRSHPGRRYAAADQPPR
jgi:Tol biopolymer transport system component